MRTPEPNDPRLADFVALNDPGHRRRVEREGDYFVVEGVLAIERLLGLIDRWSVRSIALLAQVADRLTDRLEAAEIDPAKVVVADETVLRHVVGFDLHRGALASVDRRPPLTAEAAVAVAATSPMLAPAPDQHESRNAGMLMVVEGVNDHENLGALYRNAAAFGVGAVLLDPTSADPFYRRSVRVSLGHILAVPTAALGPSPEGIAELRRLGVTTVALGPSAGTALTDLRLDAANRGDGPIAIVVGAEGPGLTDATMSACDHRAAITMVPGVDSLNVATAAAIALHHLRRS